MGQEAKDTAAIAEITAKVKKDILSGDPATARMTATCIGEYVELVLREELPRGTTPRPITYVTVEVPIYEGMLAGDCPDIRRTIREHLSKALAYPTDASPP